MLLLKIRSLAVALAAALLLLGGLPAQALLMDVEPNNNFPNIAPAFVGPGGDAGVFELNGLGDVDFLRLPGLVEGDIVTAVTTPFEVPFNDPDTLLGLFTADGILVAENDDAGETDPDLNDDFASVIRFLITESGDYVLGVTGSFDDGADGFYNGDHDESGAYILTVSVFNIVPEPSSVALLGVTGLLAGLVLRRR